MERGGRSSDERAAARDAREQARVAREQGDPPDEQQEQEEQREPSETSDGGWRAPDLRSMSRYGGGIDIYARRRLVAGLVIVGLIVILFLMLGGC